VRSARCVEPVTLFEKDRGGRFSRRPETTDEKTHVRSLVVIHQTPRARSLSFHGSTLRNFRQLVPNTNTNYTNRPSALLAPHDAARLGGQRRSAQASPKQPRHWQPSAGGGRLSQATMEGAATGRRHRRAGAAPLWGAAQVFGTPRGRGRPVWFGQLSAGRTCRLPGPISGTAHAVRGPRRTRTGLNRAGRVFEPAKCGTDEKISRKKWQNTDVRGRSGNRNRIDLTSEPGRGGPLTSDLHADERIRGITPAQVVEVSQAVSRSAPTGKKGC